MSLPDGVILPTRTGEHLAYWRQRIKDDPAERLKLHFKETDSYIKANLVGWGKICGARRAYEEEKLKDQPNEVALADMIKIYASKMESFEISIVKLLLIGKLAKDEELPKRFPISAIVMEDGKRYLEF
ncbi:MAG: hypothetical protein Q9222_002140 [Ikaeria aurantiellina]